MRAIRVKAFAAAAVLSAAGLVSVAARVADDTTLQDISRYREWARVTKAPVPVNFASPGG